MKSLSALGHKVYATMRDVAGKNADKAKELGAWEGVEVLDVELTAPGTVEKAVEGIVAKEGRLDVLVNNAGYYAGGLAESFTEADLDEMFAIHVKAPWRLMRAALPAMRSQGEGLIVNISSGLGRFSAPFMTIYNSAKFALEGLSEGLHYEVRPLGVDVALVEPGAFPTEIFGKSKFGSDGSVYEAYGPIGKIPEQMGEGMGKMFEAMKPDPQMVADAIVGLVQAEKGKRPLRTVADAMTGTFVEAANKATKEQFDNFVTAFGMQGLLN